MCRFATEKYTTKAKNLKNRFCHLTNYSVNKKRAAYEKNDDMNNDGVGSKWSLHALMRYFQENGIDEHRVMADIHDVIIKVRSLSVRLCAPANYFDMPLVGCVRH